MSSLATELNLLQDDILEMMNLVRNQFEKGKESMMNADQDLADDIKANERRVNAMELKIDRDCENILALFNPVAIDLRFVMACFKINSDLERLGDNAEGIARYILTYDKAPDKSVMEKIRFEEMYDNALNMLSNVYDAFEQQDTKLARKVFKKDKVLNDINSEAANVIAEVIKENPDNCHQYLYLLSIIRKLERVGDLTKNISEEVIFYVEAKVLKHKKKQLRNIS